MSRESIFFDDNFFSTPNKLNCYWAGFIAADGNIEERKHRKSNRLSITLSEKDHEHLKRFKNDIGYEGTIKKYKSKRTIIKGKKYDRKPTVSIRLTSQKLIDDLKKNFNIIPRKTFILEPPNITDLDLIFCYIIGYIDGDGHITKRKRDGSLIVGALGTEELMLWIRRSFNEILFSKGKLKCH